MSKRISFLAFLVLILTQLSGCVYYNTFYHARAASREAELLRESRAPGTSPGTAEKELLERVAEKCGRILQIHSDSEWADDALLLLGTTHYHQERYESAERRLTEFLSHHPDSDLRPEAEYALASVFLARGNPVSAESQLEELAEAVPPHDLSDDALALIGQARHAREKYEEAAEAYDRALERFPRSDRRAEIRFLAAENHEKAGDLDAAAREFGLVPTERDSRQFGFEARMRLAQVDLERDRPDDALRVLEELERRTDDRDDLDRVLLMKGSALEGRGAIDEAIETYEGITASHKRSDASGEAQYRIGLLLRDRRELLDEAIESFRTARDEAPRSDAAAKATAAMDDIDRLVDFLATIEKGEAPVEGDTESEEEGAGGDSSEEGSDDARESVPLAPPVGAVEDTALQATMLPTDPGLVDTTAAAIVDSATIDSVTEALLDSTVTAVGDSGAVTPPDQTDPGWTTALTDSIFAALRDSSGQDQAGTLIDSTVAALVDSTATALTDSVAQEAEVPERVEEVPEPVDEVAAARFRAAELYLFRFDDPGRALEHYLAVVEKHADSPLAPKAALALAWTLESRLDDPDGAREAYRSLADKYPDTDFAAAALQALERLDARAAP